MEDFRNRLSKMFRHFSKWARRQELECFRIYDRDLQEYPVCIDKYGDMLYIAVFENEKTKSIENWQIQLQSAISEITEIPTERQFIKTRVPQKGTSQYEKTGTDNNRFQVIENGLRFWVNLSDYLDTGLFMDHRNTRKQCRELAQDKDVLNLFAYTGAFSVYAAAGGAKSTTTVDLSKTYLKWFADNLVLNDLQDIRHKIIQADVLQWVKEAPDNSFDLIILDPPTFSNSKRMEDILDIQRDHIYLLCHMYRILRPQGVLFFSTNYRGFKLSESENPFTQSKEITPGSIPDDFRNKKIHRCWKMQKI